MLKSIKKMSEYELDWSEFAFGDKGPLKDLRATFIPAPRELSTRRISQLIKKYLPLGNVVIGVSQESHVMGLEGQPQFTMQPISPLRRLADKVNATSKTHKLYLLRHSQRDSIYILGKVRFKRVALVNGSWYTMFHMRPEYYALLKRGTPFEMLSAFADEAEAKAYAAAIRLLDVPQEGLFTDQEMLQVVAMAAKRSFDYGGYQTAVALGRKEGDAYQLLLTTHNQVVPYETYAMHFGASRERHLSPMNDLNHYDTIHAEMLAVIRAGQQGLALKGATLFINVLPCPSCARALALTDLAEIVYSQDHTSGYAVQLFVQAAKQVRRILPAPEARL